jgi:hypothetical protein
LVDSDLQCSICGKTKKDFIDPTTGKIDERVSPLDCECVKHLKMLKEVLKENNEIYSRLFSISRDKRTFHENFQYDFIINVQIEIGRIEKLKWKNIQNE